MTQAKKKEPEDEAKTKPTIAELEEMLDSEEEVPIEILPNGEIRRIGKRLNHHAPPKPLTMREYLGGEYCTISNQS